MKQNLVKLLVPTFVVIIALFLAQCSKTEASVSLSDDYSYVSPTEKAMIIEDGTDGIGDIIECIYTCINSMPFEDLSESEIEALNYVREEEYLAHDVYVAMYDLYHVPVFNNISKSELIHTTAILALMEKYNLPDPAAAHVTGVFEDAGIQELYDALVAQGSVSLQDAVMVGATIEDVDIFDLMEHLENDLDNTDLIYTFEQLYHGSRNHMRAFNAHITFQGLVYTPQYISQELFDEIVSTAWEIGNGFCVCQVCVKDNNDGVRTE